MALAGIGALVAMLATLVLTLMVDKSVPQELRDSFRIPPDDQPIGERQLIHWFCRRLKR